MFLFLYSRDQERKGITLLTFLIQYALVYFMPPLLGVVIITGIQHEAKTNPSFWRHDKHRHLFVQTLFYRNAISLIF